MNSYDSIGRRTMYTNWLSGQPTRISDADNCVAINSDGRWIVKNCREKYPFICDISPEESDNSVTAEDNSHCPTSSAWKDLGGDQCYYFGFRLVSWNNALFLCYKHRGSLASFHSQKDIDLVKDYLAQRAESESSFHIGLGKQSDGSYGWVDHSPVDYTNWEYSPSRLTSMNCVQMHPKTAKWRAVDCDEMLRNFICSFPKNKVKSGIAKVDNTTLLPLREEKSNYKLGAGGIFGIILCVTIILVLVGGTLYRFYYTPKVKLTLLEPEGL